MAILQLIDQMTALLDEGRDVPLSSYRMIDAEALAHILERMRISVPSSIRESERTLAERDSILDEARREAQQLVEDAGQRAQNMLSEESLVRMARQESDRIIADGQEQARQSMAEADAYATQVLAQLAEQIQIISAQIDNGIRYMNQNTISQQPAVPTEHAAENADSSSPSEPPTNGSSPTS
jgi:transposase